MCLILSGGFYFAVKKRSIEKMHPFVSLKRMCDRVWIRQVPTKVAVDRLFVASELAGWFFLRVLETVSEALVVDVAQAHNAVTLRSSYFSARVHLASDTMD
nr:hypothetical protein [Pandoravirus massiliensis]